MGRARHLGIRRVRRLWDEEDYSSRPPAVPAPTVTDPWCAEARELLSDGAVLACEPIPYGSNYSFILSLGERRGPRCLGVYKPRRGEAPLWDFPDGTLYRREMAAFLVSQAIGWRFIPPTVVRDGPYGIGSVQFYVAPEDGGSFFHFRRQHRSELQMITLFDHVVNNADRKPSHLIRDQEGRVWGIDHGLTFHEDWKLRTVIFDFCDQPISPELLGTLRAFRSDSARVVALRSQLASLITPREIDVFLERLDFMVARGRFPDLDPYANVPRGFF